MPETSNLLRKNDKFNHQSFGFIFLFSDYGKLAICGIFNLSSWRLGNQGSIELLKIRLFLAVVVVVSRRGSPKCWEWVES